MPTKNCQSCLMPFAKDKGVRESPDYCSYCFKDGKLCYEGANLKEFQMLSYQGMVSNGIHPLKAKFFAYMIRFAPRWKNTK